MHTPDTIQPTAYLCQQLGFDEQSRQERVALMGLGERDIPILQQVSREVIQPNSQQILDGFYDYLLGFSVMRGYLGSSDHIRRLKTTQLEYLKSFGLQFADVAYFEYRLRIGIAHERIGLPLHLYLAAYRALQALILAAVPAAIRQPASLYDQCVHSISKIVMLDSSLAIDAYTRIRIDFMNASLQALTHERDLLNTELMHDTLTGILSRRFILETLNKQLAQLSRQPERQVNIALMDLDHFKRVNDTYGHQVGDEVLKAFASCIQSEIRKKIDWVVRYGGEEFLIVLPETPHPGAFSMAERLRLAVAARSIQSGDRAIKITASFGGASTASHNRGAEKLSMDQLINQADAQLYRSKNEGRNKTNIVDFRSDSAA